MPGTDQDTIFHYSTDDLLAHLHDLGALLHACVHAGASVGFVLPFSQHDAEAFWLDHVRESLRCGRRVLFVTQRGPRVVGAVQLDCDTPANQPHRAEVRKLLVHPAFRRQGIARALMAELEAHARRRDRVLLTLDTRKGDSAEPLYVSLGYATVGAIPGYCRDPVEDRLDATTIMYKALS